LTTIGDQANLPNPITIEPAVQGQGEWLNTSIYVFRADPAFDAGTTYTVKVQAGLTDTTGGTLKEDYVWSFHTVPPSVLFSSVGDGGTYNGLEDPLYVTFNQRMDPPARGRRAPDRRAGGNVPGTIGWDIAARPVRHRRGGTPAVAAAWRAGVAGDMPAYGETLTFTPTVPATRHELRSHRPQRACARRRHT
jgi:hypothetical protein